MEIEKLPEVVLLKVFSFLSLADLGRVAKVCWIWRRIAYDRSLWRCVNLRRYAANLDEDTFHMLMRTRFSHRLTTLNLGGCRFSHCLLNELSRRCKHLKCIIFGRGSKLRQPSTKREISYDFPSELELVELRPVKGDFNFLRRISRHFCNVKHLGIGGSSSKGIVPHVFAKMQQLVILDCTNCDMMNDEVISKIAQSCHALESLCLNGCKYIYGRTFSELFLNCTGLKTLLLRYTPVRDDCFHIREWSYVPVEELDISACTHITHIGLVSLIVRVKTLIYLNLSYCGVGRAVTDEVLLQMVSKNSCSRLEMLDVRWSLALTPGALHKLCRNAPNLKCLGVYQSSNINTPAMANILRVLSRLEILEYGAFGKASISDSLFIPNLIQHCPNIRIISLINFTSLNILTDGALFNALVERCPRLQRINLCEPDQTLLALISQVTPQCRSKVTQRWQCVLPPPAHTLDSIISKINYRPRYD